MSISTGSKILASDVTDHINNKSNPHGVTAAQVGAVNKTGDTMSGNLTVEKSGAATFKGTNNTTNRDMYIESTSDSYTTIANRIKGDSNNGSFLWIAPETVTTPANFLRLARTVGGTRTIYNIYHSGNKPTPADIGAAASSHTHTDYATIAYVDQAIANSGPEMQAWNISKRETNDGETTYVYFNTADTTIKQFEIYFSDTPTYKYSSSSDYYNGSWKAADSVKLAADGGSTLIFNNRGAKYFKTSGGRLYLQFGDDDLGGCTLVMNLIVYIYR